VRKAIALLSLALSLLAQKAETPGQGSHVFIAPMGGFEVYLQAAITSKKVPLTVVLDKDKADFLVNGVWRELDGGFSGNGSLIRPLRTRKNYSASVSLVDLKSTAVLFSVAVQKSGSRDLSKEIAEELAAKIGKELGSKHN
jgi:hypothetical protein